MTEVLLLGAGVVGEGVSLWAALLSEQSKDSGHHLACHAIGALEVLNQPIRGAVPRRLRTGRGQTLTFVTRLLDVFPLLLGALVLFPSLEAFEGLFAVRSLSYAGVDLEMEHVGGIRDKPSDVGIAAFGPIAADGHFSGHEDVVLASVGDVPRLSNIPVPLDLLVAVKRVEVIRVQHCHIDGLLDSYERGRAAALTGD